MIKKILSTIFLRLLPITAILFAVCASIITIQGLSDNINRADVIVVLGNKIENNGEPSLRLQARLEKAVQLYQKRYSSNIIVSGGIDNNGYDEAAIMRNYLRAKNIPEENIIPDNKGIDTFTSAKNTAEIMSSHHWTSVIIVSQFFHITRSTFAFRQFGIPVIYSAHADYYELRDVYSLGREVVAIIDYQFRSYKS